MANEFDDETVVWRRCEHAWLKYLRDMGLDADPFAENLRQVEGIDAPVIQVGGEWRRAPDLVVVTAGVTEYWEVKYRTRSEQNEATGEREHWMSYDAFADYLAISRHRGVKVWVILYEATANHGRGQWLRVDIRDLVDHGRSTTKPGRGAEIINAFAWPVDIMTKVEGPGTIDVDPLGGPILPDEGEEAPIPRRRLERVERIVRGRVTKAVDPEEARRTIAEDPELAGDELPAQAIIVSPMLGLQMASGPEGLGLPNLPRYSVLRIGLQGVDLSRLLGLADYGIRVFIISGRGEPRPEHHPEITHFVDARIIEWSCLDEDVPTTGWIVDGQMNDDEATTRALDLADAEGGINIGQYKVVHAPSDENIIVRAGAGTGKTETMSERLVFLLATFDDTVTVDGLDHPRTFGLSDVVLVTFTREAAREMRSRIARTLLLRLRLSRLCVHPAMSWMMELSSTHISTIHAFAKSVAKQGGSEVGIGPGFRVSAQTVAFREILFTVMSERLVTLLRIPAPQGKRNNMIPASYQWIDHLTAIWDALDNNGVDLLELATDPVAESGTGSSALRNTLSQVDWALRGLSGVHHEVATATKEIIEETVTRFRAVCLENQTVPTSQLVGLAGAVLEGSGRNSVNAPRFLFVDEFQDTDDRQMDFLLATAEKFDCRLFVVGDAKQAIYRFRGAADNAFSLFEKKLEQRKKEAERNGTPDDTVTEHETLELTRNFRTGSVLLASMTDYFRLWRRNQWLPSDENVVLVPSNDNEGRGKSVKFLSSSEKSYVDDAAKLVKNMRANHPNSSIAIICRRNAHAIRIKERLKVIDPNHVCDLLVGGGFFTTEAVKEMRVLLAAVSDPEDSAAILELCATRWSAGLMTSAPPPALDQDGRAEWGSVVGPIVGWETRLATLATTGNFDVTDLEPLKKRLRLLRGMLEGMSVMSWIVECDRLFTPSSCSKHDDSRNERERYDRCLDHLLTLMDTEFAESSATLEIVSTWLKLQIATNRNEDEPSAVPVTEDETVDQASDRDEPGRTVALTVHKSKGAEFDIVVVPNTWTKFGAPKGTETEVSVLVEPGRKPRIAWRWKVTRDNKKETFESGAGNAAKDHWKEETSENKKEETRLLYVAMTRAREQLVMFLPTSTAKESWSDLLVQAGARVAGRK